jgi:hypothetical protein
MARKRKTRKKIKVIGVRVSYAEYNAYQNLADMMWVGLSQMIRIAIGEFAAKAVQEMQNEQGHSEAGCGDDGGCVAEETQGHDNPGVEPPGRD